VKTQYMYHADNGLLFVFNLHVWGIGLHIGIHPDIILEIGPFTFGYTPICPSGVK